MTTREEQDELLKKIMIGLEKGYKKLLEYKKQKNSPLVIMKEGKIVKIMPDEFDELLKKKDLSE